MGLDCINQVLVFVIIEIGGVVQLGCGCGIGGVVWSLPKIDFRAVMQWINLVGYWK